MIVRTALRVAALAAAGALIAGGLAGCRVETGAAAFVGKTRITEQRVDDIADSTGGKLARQQFGNEADQRRMIVSFLVVDEVLRRHGADEGKSVPEASANELSEAAQALGLPADSAFVRLAARYRASVGTVVEQVTPAPVDEALRRELYQQLIDSQQITANITFDQVKTMIDSEELQQMIGVRNFFAALATQYDVVVNPRYGPLALTQSGVSIANGQGTVTVEIPVAVREESPPVRDQR